MNHKKLRDTLRYVIFSELYQRLESAKAKRNAFLILEASLHCLERKGFDQVTLTMIAREAGVTRPALKRYFSNLDELQSFTIKYIRLLFQQLAINAMLKEEQPAAMLREYVRACFTWVDDFKSHALVWLAFLHRAARSKKARPINTTAAEIGAERIAALLERGREQGSFHCENIEVTAKMIQVLITGAMIAYATEDSSANKNFRGAVEEQCLALAMK